jgi:hypothetical protein
MAKDMAALKALAEAQLIGLGFPLPESIPSAQHGAWYTQGGLYRLHEGERVLPYAQASSSRSGQGMGSQVTLMISPGAITVNGAQNPAGVSQEVLDGIETAVRTGRLGQVIAKRVKQ